MSALGKSGTPARRPSGAIVPFRSKTAATAMAAVDRIEAAIDDLECRLALVEAASQPPGGIWR